MKAIKFSPENVYELGIQDSEGNQITSNCKIKCTREQAPECKLFRMFENIYYIVLEVSLRENCLDLIVHHRYFQEDGSPAYSKMYKDSNEEVCEYSLGTILDVRYFGEKGSVC